VQSLSKKLLNEQYLGKVSSIRNQSILTLGKDMCLLRGATLYGRVLNYGCGPAIHALIPFCDLGNEFHVADSNQDHLDEIQLWLDKEPDAFDWTPYFNEANKICGRSVREVFIRQRTNRVIKSDIRSFNISDFDFTYEAVISTFYLDQEAKSITEYSEYINLLMDLLLPDGKFGFLSIERTGFGAGAIDKIFSRYPDKTITTIAGDNETIVCIKGLK